MQGVILRGACFRNVDISAMKNFRLTESTTLQFRAESFNVANHPNFGLPVADIASANFGRVAQAGSPRLMQLALKVLFRMDCMGTRSQDLAGWQSVAESLWMEETAIFKITIRTERT